MSTSVRILIAGIGNVFRADDGFGVEVARRLLEQPATPGVDVVDFGIRGVDLAYALMDGYDAVILVDALPRGGSPGTLSVLELDPRALDETPPSGIALEAHSIDPLDVLHWVRQFGCPLPPIRIIGCEPARLGTEHEPEMGLSPPVQAAAVAAVRLVEETVEELRVLRI